MDEWMDGCKEMMPVEKKKTPSWLRWGGQGN
jgi:hypothetical protein